MPHSGGFNFTLIQDKVKHIKFDIVHFPCKCLTYTSSLPTAKLLLFFLHVSAANCSHLQGATNFEDMYSMLCRLSNINGKLFIHISVLRKCTVH
jgi:hypothetical protein